jgi:hypothetical protein
MQQSAHASGQSLYRLSFKGTATLLSTTQSWMKTGERQRRRVNLFELLETLIAGDPVPLRPGRHEPRGGNKGTGLLLRSCLTWKVPGVATRGQASY